MHLRWTVTAPEQGSRLDKFLADTARLGSRARAGAALVSGKVFLNDVETTGTDGSRRVTAGDVVRVWVDRPGSAGRRQGVYREGALEILFEDPALLVVNKPSGLLTVPLPQRSVEASLADLVNRHLRSGRRRPQIVHRIDRDTSGLVVFAKTGEAQAALKAQFRRREPERVYLAVVYGHPDPAQGRWRDHLAWDDRRLIQRGVSARHHDGREAISEYRIVEAFPGVSLIEVRLVTGKQNQIRAQAMLRGHPLVGEARYVAGGTAERIDFPRQALHAFRLGFDHPVTGRRVGFEAPLPADLRKLLARCRRSRRGQSGDPEGEELKAGR